MQSYNAYKQDKKNYKIRHAINKYIKVCLFIFITYKFSEKQSGKTSFVYIGH